MAKFLMIFVAATLLGASVARAAPCSPAPRVAIAIGVEEAPVAIEKGFTLANLMAASAQLQRTPVHPVLGFYAGKIGYALRRIELIAAPADDISQCTSVRVEASMVVVDRRIGIASELDTMPCRRNAALDHYRRHADAASRALHNFAAALPAKLEAAIEQRLHTQQASEELRSLVNASLDEAVGRFNASLHAIQDKVDRGSDVIRLSAPCDET